MITKANGRLHLQHAETNQLIHLMLVITKLELGGAQQVVLNTLRNLSPKQYRLFLVAGSGGWLDTEARALPGVEVHLWKAFEHPLRPLSDLWVLLRLVRLMKKKKIQIVHTHSSKAGFLGRMAAYLAGVPRIYHTVHGWPFHAYQSAALRSLYVALERLAARWSTRLIAVSEATRRKGIFYRIGKAEQYVVIFPGSDLRPFKAGSAKVRQAVRREFGFVAAAPLVGMVACLKPQKAPIDFVRAAKQVAEKIPQARFLIVGDGELRPKVEQEMVHQKLTGIIRLAGWRQDVPRLMAAMDILALSSWWEGLPCVFGQAMAASLPIVATDVEGAREAIHSGETGILVEPGNPQHLGQALINLLQSPEKRRQLGQAAQKQAQQFSLETMMKKLKRLYQI